MSLICITYATAYCPAILFLPACLRAPTEYDCHCANEAVLISLLCEMRTNVLKRALIYIFSGCAVRSMATALALALAAEVDWRVSDCLGWFCTTLQM